MKTFILSTLAAASFLLVPTDRADAGQFHLSIGSGRIGHVGHQHGFTPGYYGGGHLHHDVNPYITNPGPGGHYHWHDTTHLDYIPGRWVRRGCGWVWVPGRTVLHQDGHWDLHH